MLIVVGHVKWVCLQMPLKDRFQLTLVSTVPVQCGVKMSRPQRNLKAPARLDDYDTPSLTTGARQITDALVPAADSIARPEPARKRSRKDGAKQRDAVLARQPTGDESMETD